MCTCIECSLDFQALSLTRINCTVGSKVTLQYLLCTHEGESLEIEATCSCTCIYNVHVHAFKVEHWPGNQVVMDSSPVQDTSSVSTSHVHMLVCVQS